MKAIDKRIIVGIDIGATKTKMGYLVDGGIKTFFHEPTPQQPQEAMKMLIDGIEKAQLAYPLGGIGIGCPGPLDQKRGIVNSPPNLPKWRNVAVKEILQQKFKVDVLLENDANAGALGEALYGKARGCKCVFYMTISSGIGTGIVIDGKIHQGAKGLAGEIWAFDPACFLGEKGLYNINDLGAGNGFQKQLRDYLAKGEKTIVCCDKFCTELLVKAYRQKDALAVKIVEKAITSLSAALCFVIYLLAPDIIVLAGGLCAEPDWLVEPLVRRVKKQLAIPKLADIPIERAQLWEDAVLYGAVSLRRGDKYG